MKHPFCLFGEILMLYTFTEPLPPADLWRYSGSLWPNHWWTL